MAEYASAAHTTWGTMSKKTKCSRGQHHMANGRQQNNPHDMGQNPRISRNIAHNCTTGRGTYDVDLDRTWGDVSKT